MIGGINPANSFQIQSGNNAPARERADAARAPAASPQAESAGNVRRDLDAPTQARDSAPVNQPAAVSEVSEPTDRRIEASRAAEDARLERFRADELPLPTSQAMSAFAGVAAAGQEFESGSVLSGIDIMV